MEFQDENYFPKASFYEMQERLGGNQTHQK